MMKEDVAIKPYLIEKFKQEHCLWSYDNNSIHDMPDDMLIELVMQYLAKHPRSYVKAMATRQLNKRLAV